MKLSDEDFNIKARTLGLGSALLFVSGYYGEPAIFLVTNLSNEEFSSKARTACSSSAVELAARVLAAQGLPCLLFTA